MTSIIKNQIIKHLSAFARNLTPDQISVEVLRGKGELRNIELNETVLSERLELPSWLQICHARCNRVVVKVPWTKIKSSAVELHVDEIEVMIRLSLEAPASFKKASLNQSSKAYDLAERVIEGLALYVQTVIVQFESDCFGGSLMFSRLSVESKSPLFKDEKDLHMTRVHDKNLHQVLFFKQVSWQLFKIEASALKQSDKEQKSGGVKRKNALNSPLRLITTGEGKCNIAIKKNDLNCTVIDGRIEVILEEILWVATLLQVKSAIDFYKHIMDLAKCSEKQIETNPFLIDLQPKVAPFSKHLGKASTMEAFKKYDFPRSSHHLLISKIDLHLFDDSTDDLLPKDWGINNGAIQATLHKLRVDFYPSHSVFTTSGKFADRSDWVCYNPFNSCTDLTKKQLSHYLDKLSKNMEPSLHERFERMWPHLCSQNVVIRIEDIVVQCVSEQSTRRDSLQHMFVQKKSLQSSSLSSIISFFHLEFVSYYFPASNAYPRKNFCLLALEKMKLFSAIEKIQLRKYVPPDSTHLVLGPFEFLVDYRSVRWMIYVFENILNAFDLSETVENSSIAFQPDFRLEFLEPRIVLMAPEVSNDIRLPKRFLIDSSAFYISNFTLSNISNYINTENDTAFPQHTLALNNIVNECMKFLDSNFSHMCTEFSELLSHGVLQKVKKFSREQDHDHSVDSIFRSIENMQIFISTPSISFLSDYGKNTYEIPIVSDVSLLTALAPQSPVSVVLVKLLNDIDVVLDHFQFVRLLQLHTKITDLVDLIDADRKFFSELNCGFASTNSSDVPLALFCNIDKINVHLILPPGPVPSPYDNNIGDQWDYATFLSSGWFYFTIYS